MSIVNGMTDSDSLPFKLIEGSVQVHTSIKRSSSVKLNLICPVKEQAKDVFFTYETFPIKPRYLVEFVPTGQLEGKRTVGGEGRRRRREIFLKPLVKFTICLSNKRITRALKSTPKVVTKTKLEQGR